MAVQPLLKSGIRKSIGTGHNTLVWADPWLPTTPARPAIPCGPSFNPSLKILDRLRELVRPSDIPLIKSLRPTRTPRASIYCWNLTKSGIYSVKSGYELAMTTAETSEPAQTTKKIQYFIWQAITDCVLVCNALSNRHCGNDRTCPRCGADEETTNHCLFECPPSVQAWALADIPHAPGSFPCNSIYSNLDYVLWRARERGIPDNLLAPVPWVIWYIWKARNDKAFNGKDTTPLETIQLAKSEAESWRIAQIIDKPDEEDDGDASWHKDDTRFSGGMVLTTEDGMTTYGSFASNQVLTLLHVEFQTLLWAM
ncbi:hypothetical protein Bca52824_060715 [Brassica carinata]|uniref:Reverse transcriptase zinc-binding domain-containing protein n=1 Tax=Brassica carinata TaxID=52824 RepID=A0A8X7UFV7_BRACI|nr:hypothetical protein Bca52824_060715 [Brassica carinata]